ncbi:MAG: YegS/Rv2252/BmrU family lipid kinase [Lachnospiraceae bacterium]|nr:YegS/Rv2252/BmrU family lipid kinase [Lachnospiraceae bacterium]
MSKRMLFIFNPLSGKAQIRTKLMDILDVFIKAGYQVEIHVTQRTLDARKVVEERGFDVDLIVGSGGDGTLNEIVSGIMGMERKPRVGYIPAGTTNDFAASHKIPRNMLRAAENIVMGTPCPVDIGTFNERFFTYVAAFGAFTDVPYKTPREIKAVLGHPAYILEAAKSLGGIKARHIVMETEKERYEGDVLVGMVSNANQIAGFKGLNGKNVRMDDGLFEVLLVENPQNILQLPEVVTSLLQNGHKSKLVRHFTASRVKFRFEEPAEWVLDGEFGGKRKEVVIENRYRAVQIMKMTHSLPKKS